MWTHTTRGGCLVLFCVSCQFGSDLWGYKRGCQWLVFIFSNTGMAVPGSVCRSFPAHTSHSLVFAGSSQKAWRFKVNQNRCHTLPWNTSYSVAQSLNYFQDRGGKVRHLLPTFPGADAAERRSASPIVTYGDLVNLTQEPLSPLFALQRACTLP